MTIYCSYQSRVSGKKQIRKLLRVKVSCTRTQRVPSPAGIWTWAWLTPKPGSSSPGPSLSLEGRTQCVCDSFLRVALLPSLTSQSTKSKTHSPPHCSIGNLICCSTRTLEGREGLKESILPNEFPPSCIHLE